MKQDSKGAVWVSYNGSNKLASMDPVTMEVREHVLPDPATRSGGWRSPATTPCGS